MEPTLNIGDRVRHRFDLPEIAGTIVGIRNARRPFEGAIDPQPFYFVRWDALPDGDGVSYFENVLERLAAENG